MMGWRDNSGRDSTPCADAQDGALDVTLGTDEKRPNTTIAGLDPMVGPVHVA